MATDREASPPPGSEPTPGIVADGGRRVPWRIAVLAVGVVAVALAARSPRVASWSVRVVGFVESGGSYSFALYVAFYAAAVVALIPGSAMTLAGGYLFGPAWGMVLVSVASMLGATAAFLVARSIGRGPVRARIGQNPRFLALDRAIARRGAWVVFLLRLSPVVPFNVLNYALGLTGIGLGPYVAASWVGMLPGTILYVMIGATFGPGGRPGGLGAWGWAAVVLSTLAATVVIGRLARNALQDLPGGAS